MIVRDKIADLVKEKLGKNMFLVDVTVSPANVIRIEIDSFDGLTVNQCVEVSRHIENNLDRETEDFELQVSSPGIDQFFKVNDQYRKNIGHEVEVFTAGNDVYSGKLAEAGENGIVLEVTVKEKHDGERKAQMVTKMVSFDYVDIKKAKVIISFR
jgi:ribosome maturation factor RimP